MSEQIPKKPRKEWVKQRQNLLAYRFREAMTKGQMFKEVNPYRKSFFEEVIEGVNDVVFPSLFFTI